MEIQTMSVDHGTCTNGPGIIHNLTTGHYITYGHKPQSHQYSQISTHRPGTSTISPENDRWNIVQGVRESCGNTNVVTLMSVDILAFLVGVSMVAGDFNTCVC